MKVILYTDDVVNKLRQAFEAEGFTIGEDPLWMEQNDERVLIITLDKAPLPAHEESVDTLAREIAANNAQQVEDLRAHVAKAVAQFQESVQDVNDRLDGLNKASTRRSRKTKAKASEKEQPASTPETAPPNAETAAAVSSTTPAERADRSAFMEKLRKEMEEEKNSSIGRPLRPGEFIPEIY